VGEEPGEEGVDGDAGEMDPGVVRPEPVSCCCGKIRCPVTGDVIGEALGLRKPSPMLDVVGKGAGTSIDGLMGLPARPSPLME